jgi:hypothetical protein
LSFVVGLGLTLPVIWHAWSIIGPNTYLGADGKTWQSLIRAVCEFAPAFHVNILYPLEGVAGFGGTPINVWADPTYWPFFSEDRLFATQGSTLIAYAAVASAIFLLSRIWRVPLGASIAGSLTSFIVFPSFSYIFGFSTLLSIVPDAAMGAALMIVAAGLSYSVTDLRWKTIASGTVFIALWLCFIIYSNPTWFVGAGFIFAPLLAFCILNARSAKVVTARIAAFVAAFALLYVLGPVDYVRTLFAYSARIYFHNEWARPQDVLYASWAFDSPRLLWTYVFFLSGWVAGLIFGGRSERKAAFVSLLLFAVFLVEASIYLFVPIHWPATLPVYYEVLMGPIYAFGAIVGYSAFFATVWHNLTESFSTVTATSSLSSGENARRTAPLRGFIVAVPVLSGIAFVPALGAWYVTDEIYAHTYTPNLINTLTESWPETDELDKYLGDNIGLKSTNQFRGMTLLNSIFSYETSLVVASLWGRFVPFLNMYSDFYMPGLYYFISHFSPPEATVAKSSSETMEPRRAWWTYRPLDAHSKKILQGLGVRYVLQSLPEDDERRPPDDAVLRHRRPPDDAVLRLELGPATVAGRQFTQKVYEYSDANVGNYSPTNVLVARDAPGILQHIWSASFDPRQSIVLSERIEEPLVEATTGKMFFERGAIRVQAESRGRSLLLLPVQYSHCLVLSDVRARLLPANLIQTALLFRGIIDLRIHLGYGLFRPGCRNQDLADLPGLGIFNESEIAPPWPELHPYAMSSAADLPGALGAVIKKLATAPR